MSAFGTVRLSARRARARLHRLSLRVRALGLAPATLGLLVCGALAAACAGSSASAPRADARLAGPADLWLEAAHGERALAWAAEQDRRTLAVLGADPRFARNEAEAEAILTDPGRIVVPAFLGDEVYDVRQDREHPFGLWRRSPAAAFLAGAPRWETLLDLDAYAATEGRPFLLTGFDCRPSGRCLLSLAPRGTDARRVREFDVAKKDFVADGFALPEFVSDVSWEDDDTLLVATDWGPGSLTASGYSRSLRRWRRGTPLASAEPVFEVPPASPFLGSPRLLGAAGPGSLVVSRPLDYWTQEFWLLRGDGSRLRQPLPGRVDFLGEHAGALLLRLGDDWTPPGGGAPFPAGALVAIAKQALAARGVVENARLVYRPASDESVQQVVSSGDRLYVALLTGYRSRVLDLVDGAAGPPAALDLDGADFATLQGPGPSPGSLLLATEGMLAPPRLWLFDPASGGRRLVTAGVAQFDTAGLREQILETESADGTPIAYTVVARADLALDGSHPTLVYGYGGFDVPLTPRYEPLFGKLWLERGGVYVHAYLRGGGERGPAWHRGAMRTHREQPWDDMAAVVADLQRRGFTSPAHTGILGRSNGGLMAAAVMERVPERLGAVVVGGPLIDMLRYQLLPPGASWAAEYGTVDDADTGDFLRAHSPYQQLRRDARYPVPLVITSSYDDRVAPGHARRFAARLQELGHDALFFEDEQGGHYWELAGGPSPGDWRLRARARAVEFTYLQRALGLE